MRHHWNAAITIAFGTVFLSVLIVGRAVAASSTTSPGTVQVRGGTLQYIAADGFRNKVDVTGGPSRFAATTDLVVTDATGLVAGAGCSQITSTRVDCGAGGVSSVLLDGGDRSDALGSETYLATTLYGGYGDDGLGGAGPATFGDGGPGNDILYGSGTSTLIGSSGNDLIEGAVHGVDLIYGGAGDDTLNGIGRNDVVKGGDGADTIDGRAGDDMLRGGAGDDSIEGGDGNDRISGNTGADTLSGSNNNDRINTNTRYHPVDGSPDSVACGNGADFVTEDDLDTANATCDVVIVHHSA